MQSTIDDGDKKIMKILLLAGAEIEDFLQTALTER